VYFENGTEWTYSELRAWVRRTGAALQELGVRQCEHVVVRLPNGPDAVTLVLALGYVGAVYVPSTPRIADRSSPTCSRTRVRACWWPIHA
jgi:acyl-coenzyme A synthetase/AMP-(fatty) acid ligase